MTTKNQTISVAANKIFHLVTEESRGKPLCGAEISDAEIGSYGEHLETSGGVAQWVREVFDRTGSPVKGCAACLSLYPTVLL